VTTPGTEIVGVPTFAKVLGAGTYSELLWAVGIVAILQMVLSFTRWGLYTVATGGNKLGAAEAGINVRLVVLRNFMLCAVTAGFAGILESVRTSSITPDPSGSNQFLLYLNSQVGHTAYQTWAGMTPNPVSALPPERFTFDVVNMSVQ